jgi:CubicO group peptidase (beta-lactamase class C family)
VALGAALAIERGPAAGWHQPTLWPTPDWTRAAPDAVGLSAERIASIDRGIRDGRFGHVDRLVVIRNGRLAVDDRYARDYRTISRGRLGPIGCGEGCTDPAWLHEFNYYHPDWHPYYQGRDLHTLQSVTKSIAATVIGVALGRGQIGSLEQPFLDFFKERDLTAIDARLHRATLFDLLTMRSGIEWHEQDRPLDDTNTTVQLEKSRDWIGFTLSQPMDADPGVKWTYNSGGSHLMSGIIHRATGRHVDDYAARFLFGPLGIREFHWKKSPSGHPDAEGGLYLSGTDLAKIGYLYLHDGVWDGRRILPEGWVSRATTRHASTAPGQPGTNPAQWDYGLQWWITARQGSEIWAGRGFGGQLLLVIPSREIVAVVHAWNIFGDKVENIFEPLVDALLTPQPPPAASDPSQNSSQGTAPRDIR